MNFARIVTQENNMDGMFRMNECQFGHSDKHVAILQLAAMLWEAQFSHPYTFKQNMHLQLSMYVHSWSSTLSPTHSVHVQTKDECPQHLLSSTLVILYNNLMCQPLLHV